MKGVSIVLVSIGLLTAVNGAPIMAREQEGSVVTWADAIKHAEQASNSCVRSTVTLRRIRLSWGPMQML